MDWFNSNDIWQNGLILFGYTTLVSATVSIFLFLIQESVKSYNSKKENTKQLIENYISPLIDSLRALNSRLSEIRKCECLYLTANKEMLEKNGYLKYKYNSTLYRFCAVLGCIYILRQERCFTKLAKPYKNLRIKLDEFAAVLADGSWVDELNVYMILKSYNKNFISHDYLKESAIKIENAVFKSIMSDDKSMLDKLNEAEKKELVGKVTKILGLDIQDTKEMRGNIIKELSRKTSLIFRDLQMAIGSKMVKYNGQNYYGLIDLDEFERQVRKNEKTFKRVTELFSNLDYLSLTDNKTQYDFRYIYLKCISCKTNELIAYLSKKPLIERNMPSKNKLLPCALPQSLGIIHKQCLFSYSINGLFKP